MHFCILLQCIYCQYFVTKKSDTDQNISSSLQQMSCGLVVTDVWVSLVGVPDVPSSSSSIINRFPPPVAISTPGPGNNAIQGYKPLQYRKTINKHYRDAKRCNTGKQYMETIQYNTGMQYST